MNTHQAIKALRLDDKKKKNDCLDEDLHDLIKEHEMTSDLTAILLIQVIRELKKK